MLSHLFGSFRMLIARHTYHEADRYFHQGIGHEEERAFDDPFQLLRRHLSPVGHVHLQGRTAVEIMPWLRWTLRADPTHVEAWLVAAYWLQRDLHRPDLARAVYREAALANPHDYRIFMEWARLLLREGSWGGATRLCDQALARWPSPLTVDDETARLDRARLMEWRGYLWAWLGEREKALQSLEIAQSLRPQHRIIREEIVRIRLAQEIAGVVGPGLLKLRDDDEAAHPPRRRDDHH